MFTIISFFQKLIKGGAGIRAGGWKIFQKLISGGGDDYSVLESKCFVYLNHKHTKVLNVASCFIVLCKKPSNVDS